MKKSMLVALVVAFIALMASFSSYADVTGVADTSKEGSLLIWPYIDTTGGNETYIVITNSFSLEGGNETEDRLVNIKCYWEARPFPWDGGSSCPLSDTIFYLSNYNPLIFRASDGANLDGFGVVPGIGKDMKGILKCWAVSPNDNNQIAWNHLSGYGIVLRPGEVEPKTSAFKYSAWRFAANVITDNNGTAFADGFWVGKTLDGNDKFNTLKLWGGDDTAVKHGTASAVCSGGVTINCCRNNTRPIKIGYDFASDNSTFLCVQWVDTEKCPRPYEAPACDKPMGTYDACPSYLTFDFLAEPSSPTNTDGHAFSTLALAPCKENLRSEGDDGTSAMTLATRLAFSVWNANEVKYTGTYACVNCNGEVGKTYDVPLSSLNKGTMNYFQQTRLHTDSGRFRVEGLATGGCPGAVKTPLVGIMFTRLINPPIGSSIDLIATGGTASGGLFNKASINTSGTRVNSNPAYIYWDPSGIPEKPKK